MAFEIRWQGIRYWNTFFQHDYFITLRNVLGQYLQQQCNIGET